MSTIVAIRAGNDAETRYVARARGAFSVRFPGQAFDAVSWSIRHLKKAGAGQGNASLLFTRIARDHRGEQIPASFADALKAFLILSGNAPGTMYNASTGGRWLWEAVLERLAGNQDAFTWAALVQDDVEEAEQLMLKAGMSASSAYRRCVELRTVLDGLAAAGVISPMDPVIRSPRQESLDRMTLEGREARNALLPSGEAIDALADLYSGRYELDAFDELLCCVPALMFATGLRIIEVLQLSKHPIRREGDRDFVFYFKAKGGSILEEKIPLSSGQAQLVRDVVARAQRLTAVARERARELVRSPAAFPLPDWAAKKEWLSAAEVSRLLGLDTAAHIQKEVVHTKCGSNGLMFQRAALQAWLQTTRERISRESIHGVTPRADGSWLHLDEALFIGFRYAGESSRGANPLLVSLIRQQQVGTFLGGAANGLKSIFERLGLRERDGRCISLNSHQLRHYVTSKASAAGVSDTHLMRWQRRAHERDLEAYKHLTSEERLRRLRSEIRGGRLKGEIATMYFALAAEEKDVFLENVVQAIHVTHLGFCVHDFNTAPCPSAMNCVKRCGSFLFDAEDPAQRGQLLALQARNARALGEAQSAQATRGGLLVEEWVRDLQATDEGIRLILEAKPSGETALLQPFSDEPTKFKPLG